MNESVNDRARRISRRAFFVEGWSGFLLAESGGPRYADGAMVRFLDKYADALRGCAADVSGQTSVARSSRVDKDFGVTLPGV